MKNKISFDKNKFGLLSVFSFNTIVKIYINTFLVAYILNIGSGNFFNVALYYVVAYLTCLFGYILFSHIAGKINNTHLVQLSTFLYIPLLITIAVMDDDIVNYIVPISLAYNSIFTLHNVSFNAIENEKIDEKQLQKYNTLTRALDAFINIIIPITFGSIIDSSDIQVIAIFIVVVCALEFASTLFIDKSTAIHRKFNFKGYFRDCINCDNHKKSFKLLFASQFFYGFKGGLFTLVTILIVLTFKTNTSLGIITSVISLCSVLLLFLTNKVENKTINKLTIPITLLVAISMVLLLIDVNKVNVIIFNFCFSAILVLVNRGFFIRRSGFILAIDRKDYILEHQVFCNIGLEVGRSLFYIILLSVSFSQDILIYKLILAIGLVAVLIFGTLAYLTSNEYDKILIEKELLRHKDDKPLKTIESNECELEQNQDNL